MVGIGDIVLSGGLVALKKKQIKLKCNPTN